MGGVCAGLRKKPMARPAWEVQDRGSRTKFQRGLPQRHRDHREKTKKAEYSRKGVDEF